MKKLIVFSGLSGSGKSTAIQKEFGNTRTKIVSYDAIRKSLTTRRSDIPPVLIMQYVFADAGYWLKRGHSVVVDAVNLHPHDRLRWEAVAWAFDMVQLEWREMDTPLELCVERDAQRNDPVGKEAIEKQYESCTVRF